MIYGPETKLLPIGTEVRIIDHPLVVRGGEVGVIVNVSPAWNLPYRVSFEGYEVAELSYDIDEVEELK